MTLAIPCPRCGERLQVADKGDRRVVACSNPDCRYTTEYLPQDLLMREANAPTLPGFGDL